MVSLGVGVIVLASLVHGSPARPEPGRTRAPGTEPWIAAAHLLGGFRPLAVDFLWLRADTLFRTGRLWELAALFRGIAALDPGNGLVREYAAWHLAYNVALAESDPERRFEWFLQGVRILEDGSPAPRGSWRLKTFKGRMFLDRLDAGVIPRFEERVRARFESSPLELATRWFEEAVREPDARPLAHVHWLAVIERNRQRALEAGDAEGASRWEKKGTVALARASRLFPDTDWSFIEEYR